MLKKEAGFANKEQGWTAGLLHGEEEFRKLHVGEREATKPVLNRRRQLTNTNNSQGVQKTIKNIARMNMGTTVPRKAIVTEWHTKKGSWLCQKRARLNSWSVAGRIGVVVCQTANCNSDLENNCEKWVGKITKISVMKWKRNQPHTKNRESKIKDKEG